MDSDEKIFAERTNFLNDLNTQAHSEEKYPVTFTIGTTRPEAADFCDDSLSIISQTPNNPEVDKWLFRLLSEKGKIQLEQLEIDSILISTLGENNLNFIELNSLKADKILSDLTNDQNIQIGLGDTK